MKTLPFFLSAILIISGCSQNSTNISKPSSAVLDYDSANRTNNFYDNTESYSLAIPELTIAGEVANPGKADLSSLQVHSVIVKETILDSAGRDKFTGAFRYDGYSLFDILDRTILKKANEKEFSPVIDLYVEITNDRGDKVVFSWGEIYYPNNLHRIIIATRVARIVPSKTKELWPLPIESKIVAGNDLITERNISNPSMITVRSFSASFKVTKGLSPMYAKEFTLFAGSNKVAAIAPACEKDNITYNTVFYGRGRGIHSTSPFSGTLLKDDLARYFPFDKKNLRTGFLCLAGLDGYRCVISFSELFNRNDQQEFLLVRTKPGEDGGLFRIFAAGDFFSDRAVKSIAGIYLLNRE